MCFWLQLPEWEVDLFSPDNNLTSVTSAADLKWTWKNNRSLATEVVHFIYRYSEIARGAMIAGKIINQLLALPAAVTRTAEMIANPAQNGAKRERPTCSKRGTSFAMRVARHHRLPKMMLGRTFLA